MTSADNPTVTATLTVVLQPHYMHNAFRRPPSRQAKASAVAEGGGLAGSWAPQKRGASV